MNCDVKRVIKEKQQKDFFVDLIAHMSVDKPVDNYNPTLIEGGAFSMSMGCGTLTLYDGLHDHPKILKDHGKGLDLPSERA